MLKKAYFDFKKQPTWLNRFVTAISLVFILTFFLLAGFGLWKKLWILITVFLTAIILVYASRYLANIFFK